VEGQSNVFHEVQTDVATRGLIRDLADSPSVALTALIAQLFKGVRLATYASTEDSALSIRPTAYERQRRKPIEGLDQEVWSRIESRKEAYVARTCVRSRGSRPCRLGSAWRCSPSWWL